MNKKKIILISIISIIIILLISLTIILFVNKVDTNTSIDKIMNRLYKDISKEELPSMISDIVVSDDNEKTYIGFRNLDYINALVRKSFFIGEKHQVLLIRLRNEKYIEDIKTKIKNNISNNDNKFSFNKLEEDEIVIESNKDLILVVIIKDENIRNKIVEEFKKI